MLLFVFASVLTLFFMTWRWFSHEQDQYRIRWVVIAMLLAIPFCWVADSLAIMAVSHFGAHEAYRYDLYVYNLDGIVGHPSFVLGRLVRSSRFLTAFTNQVYGMYVGAMVAVFCVYSWFAFEEKAKVARIFAINLLSAIPIYLAFPVSGPMFAFSNYPYVQGHVAAHPIMLNAPQNGVPSLHNSNAMLFMALLWRWKWGRVVGILFVLSTMFTTLGNGQHYAFDILCAAPYAFLVWKAGHAAIWDRLARKAEKGAASVWVQFAAE